MGRKLNIGLVQMRCAESAEANLEAAAAGVREAASRGADVICLPELFKGRYFCQTEDETHFDRAEPVPGPTTKRFEGLAAELDVVLILSLFERRTEGLYHNTAAVLDGTRGYMGKYRKMHIPDDPRYYEKFYFTPGDLGFRKFDTSKGPIGVLICWDQWYPEAARLTALHGAQILFYPTAIGWHPQEKESHGSAQHQAWEVSQRAHAVANGCFVVAVNRTGFEPAPDRDGGPSGAAAEDGASRAAADDGEGIEFWGRSFVAGPDGAVISRADTSQEEVLVVEIDLGRIRESRTGWPFLRDRRIDAYQGITKRYLEDG